MGICWQFVGRVALSYSRLVEPAQEQAFPQSPLAEVLSTTIPSPWLFELLQVPRVLMPAFQSPQHERSGAGVPPAAGASRPRPLLLRIPSVESDPFDVLLRVVF